MTRIEHALQIEAADIIRTKCPANYGMKDNFPGCGGKRRDDMDKCVRCWNETIREKEGQA